MAAKHDMDLTGAELIAAERHRQIKKERWTAAHDDEHDDGSLLLAAICYAAPVRVFVQEHSATGVSFNDPWPDSWSQRWDKRGHYGNAYEAGNGIADPDTYTPEQCLDLLVKAGALIAAEIDRQKRALGVPAVAPAQPVAYHDKDQPNGIAWCPGYPEALKDITPLYANERASGKNLRGALAHGVPEVVPPAKLVNGQWEGAPLSQFPELQEEVRKDLADGTLSVGGDGVPVPGSQTKPQ